MGQPVSQSSGRGEPEHPETNLTSSNRNRFLWLAVLIVVSPWPVAVAVYRSDNLNDDTYITLTYARNLAEGSGFVYNHGGPSLGTTTPLWALLCAAAGKAAPGSDLADLAVGLSAACWIAAAWLFYLGRRVWRIDTPLSVILASTILIGGWQTLGTEFYLFELLLVSALLAACANRPGVSGLLCGLLFLTRGEGILLVPCLLVYPVLAGARPWHDPGVFVRFAARLSAGFIAVLLPWCGYAWFTFGGILPDTLDAKMAQGTFQARFAEMLVPWALAWWHRSWLWPLTVTYWALAFAGAYRIVRHDRRLAVFLLWIAAYVAGYAILGVAAYYWYQYPIYFVWMLLVGTGMYMASRGVRGLTFLPARVRCAVAPALVAILLAAQLHPASLVRYEGDWRAPMYRDAATWLNDHAPSGASVGAAEVGYLGYFTRLAVVDLFGLTTPDTLPFAARQDFAGAIVEHLPDFYLSCGYSQDLPVIESEEFQRRYHIVHMLEGEPYLRPVTIYARNSSMARPEDS